jgi:hypothetical protein
MVAETPPPQAGALIAVGSAQSAAAAKPTHDLEAIKQLATQTKAIGVIMPPPDIRAIVDKTAQFVAKNGVRLRPLRLSCGSAAPAGRCAAPAACCAALPHSWPGVGEELRAAMAAHAPK